jgi:phenylalanyl-tRNA synthetase beta chain
VSRVNKKIGIDVSADQVVALLQKMSLQAKKTDKDNVEVSMELKVNNSLTF